MTVAGEGRVPGRTHILRVAEGSGISKKQSLEIIDEVASAVSEWRLFAEESDVPKATAMRISATLSGEKSPPEPNAAD